LFTSHHITSHHSNINSKQNNQQYTIRNPQTNTIHKRKMGRAKAKPKANPKAKPKAKPKADLPVVLPPAATRKRAQVLHKHEPDKRKSLKGAMDKEDHGPDVLEGGLKEEDKPDEVVDEEVFEEENWAAEAVKELEGVSVTDDSEYRQPIGLLAFTYTLVLTSNYCISTFYFCETWPMTESKDPSFLVLEVVVMNIMSMSEILERILGGIIISISILDIIFWTDFHFGYQ
jgi:hypothetical protein